MKNRKKYLLMILSVAFTLTGCHSGTSEAPITSSLDEEESEPVIETIRTDVMQHPMQLWEAEFHIPDHLPYNTMDIHVYRLDNGEWKAAEVFPNNPVSEKEPSMLLFEQTDTTFSIAYRSYEIGVEYYVPFEKKTEGYAGGYAWAQPSVSIVADEEIPLYGHVRNEGYAINAFSVEGFETETNFEEGILFTVSFSAN